MNIAFLFNSDHKSLGSYYGPPVMNRILGANELQQAGRHMRVSVGDILTYMAAAERGERSMSFLVKLCRAVYRPKLFDRLIYDRLEATHGKATVYCWLFQNMTAAVAEPLHLKLSPDPAYLGAQDVDFSEPLHLSMFRNSLIEAYRLQGNRCSILYSMGDNEDPDPDVRESFEQHGFTVDYEDVGARRTIFDNYDSLEHFKRVEDFKLVFAGFKGLDADRASDLALSLEEIHPKLFDAFSSAARTLERAETAEDYAQAALSGRRLLEQTADYLFPPRKGKWHGHKIGRADHGNRLWAYIEQTVAALSIPDSDSLSNLGKEADRLIKLFNAGLHADPTRKKVEAAFVALVIWLSEVISLSPAAARRPYLAYEEAIMGFIDDVTRDRPE